MLPSHQGMMHNPKAMAHNCEHVARRSTLCSRRGAPEPTAESGCYVLQTSLRAYKAHCTRDFELTRITAVKIRGR